MPALPRQLETLARILAYILGHRPDEFGLVLDDAGFVPLKKLLAALAAEPGWAFVRQHHLEKVAALASSPRLELAGDRIRVLDPAPPQLRRQGEAPPTYLYFAITPKAHPRVWEEGLKAPGAEELALARRPEMALNLGRRRTPEPVLVKIQAQAAARKGVSFTAYGEELFLAAAVPRTYLELPAPPPEKAKPRPEKPAVSPPLPGELRLDLPAFLREGPKPRDRRGGEPAWKAATRRERRRRQRDQE